MKSAPIPKNAQQRAVHNFRQKALSKGLVRFEVLVSATDKLLIKRLAEILSSETQIANKIRQDVDQVLCAATHETGFDIFGSDISDAAFENIFDRVTQSDWRAVEL